jgi:hypothetical protein
MALVRPPASMRLVHQPVDGSVRHLSIRISPGPCTRNCRRCRCRRESQASTRILEAREAGRLDPAEWSDRAIARHVGVGHATVSNTGQARRTRALRRERGLDTDAIDDTKLYRIATLGLGMDDLVRGAVKGDVAERGDWTGHGHVVGCFVRLDRREPSPTTSRGPPLAGRAYRESRGSAMGRPDQSPRPSSCARTSAIT